MALRWISGWSFVNTQLFLVPPPVPFQMSRHELDLLYPGILNCLPAYLLSILQKDPPKKLDHSKNLDFYTLFFPTMFRASALRQGIDYKILLSQFLKVFRNLQGFLYKEKEKTFN